MMDKIKAAASAAYNRLGDPRTKNMLILALALMSAFGVIAPDTATGLRNVVLGLAA
jgi:hypothetical protein